MPLKTLSTIVFTYHNEKRIKISWDDINNILLMIDGIMYLDFMLKFNCLYTKYVKYIRT